MFGLIAYALFILKVQLKDPVWWSATRAFIGVAGTIVACVTIGREEHNQGQGIPIALRDTFSAARARYEQSQEAAKPYTTLAKRRVKIMSARYRRDQTNDFNAYKDEVAAYTDPADFAPYTQAELENYTAKMEDLTASFDSLTVSSHSLGLRRPKFRG